MVAGNIQVDGRRGNGNRLAFKGQSSNRHHGQLLYHTRMDPSTIPLQKSENLHLWVCTSGTVENTNQHWDKFYSVSCGWLVEKMFIIFTNMTNNVWFRPKSLLLITSNKHSSLSQKIKWDVITPFNVAHLFLLSIIIFWHNPYTHWSIRPHLEWVYEMGSCRPSLTPFPLAMDNSKAKSNGVLSVFQNQFMYLHRSFQKFYVWWHHCALKSLVLVAPLLL